MVKREIKEASDRLLGFAHLREQEKPTRKLADFSRGLGKFSEDLLLPQDFSFASHCEIFGSLTDEQKLALNHWAYYILYFRLAVGEKFSIPTNRAIAKILGPKFEIVGKMLNKESDEEVDHSSTFDLVGNRIAEYYGFSHIKFPMKPFRNILGNARFIESLVNKFRDDFIVCYFLGRSIGNHIGRSFEMEISKMKTSNSMYHKLSFLHSLDENKHTAVSYLMTEAVMNCRSESGPRSILYSFMERQLRRTMAMGTFSYKATVRQQSAMSFLALRQMKCFSTWSNGRLKEFVTNHFGDRSGWESAMSDYMPKRNDQIIRKSSWSEQKKNEWRHWLKRNGGNIKYYTGNLSMH